MCIVCLTVGSVVAVAMSLTLSSCSKKEDPVKLGNIDAKGQVVPIDLPDWVANRNTEIPQNYNFLHILLARESLYHPNQCSLTNNIFYGFL